ncbi:MAG: hypothetical protein OEY55_15355, partial [Acidimicrobiia bacterium]|nr:hypothetical protein [Acidimicrobiia bacterium]
FAVVPTVAGDLLAVGAGIPEGPEHERSSCSPFVMGLHARRKCECARSALVDIAARKWASG